jgi:hypothetical protein
MFLSLMLVAMVGVRKKAQRERMARLRAADIPDLPSFWDTTEGSKNGDSGPEQDGSE